MNEKLSVFHILLRLLRFKSPKLPTLHTNSPNPLQNVPYSAVFPLRITYCMAKIVRTAEYCITIRPIESIIGSPSDPPTHTICKMVHLESTGQHHAQHHRLCIIQSSHYKRTQTPIVHPGPSPSFAKLDKSPSIQPQPTNQPTNQQQHQQHGGLNLPGVVFISTLLVEFQSCSPPQDPQANTGVLVRRDPGCAHTLPIPRRKKVILSH